MADYTLADFLQNRSPWSPRTLQEVQNEMMRNGEIDTPVFGGAMPQSEAEWQHHSPSSLLPYASILPPVAAYNAGQSITQGVMDRDPWAAARGVAEAGLSLTPFVGPMRAPAAATRTAPPRAAPPEPGPWTPGYMDTWLASRPSAIPQRAAPQLDQARRWGRTERDLHDYLPHPYGNVPPLHWGAGAAGMGGAGRVAYDSVVHGMSPDESLWRWITMQPPGKGSE